MGRESHVSRLPERDRERIKQLRANGNSYSTVARAVRAWGVSGVSRSSIFRYLNRRPKEQPRPEVAKASQPIGPVEYNASRTWDELVALFGGNVAEAIRASKLKKKPTE